MCFDSWGMYPGKLSSWVTRHFKLSNNLLKLRAKEINYASVYWLMWILLVMLRLCYSAQICKEHTGTVCDIGVPKAKMKFNALINIRSWHMRDISSRINHCNTILFSKLMPSKPLIYLAPKEPVSWALAQCRPWAHIRQTSPIVAVHQASTWRLLLANLALQKLKFKQALFLPPKQDLHGKRKGKQRCLKKTNLKLVSNQSVTAWLLVINGH